MGGMRVVVLAAVAVALRPQALRSASPRRGSVSAASSGAGAAGEAPSDGDDPYKASVQIGLSEKFTLVYTCGRCETRNSVRVSRVAWNEGLVIGKCMGCDARHMLADNTGLTDETNSSKFSNVVNEAIARGEEVRRLGLDDAGALADAGVELLPGGNVSLVARSGEAVKAFENGTGRVLATQPLDAPGAAPSAIITDVGDEPELPPVTVVDDTAAPPPPPPPPAADGAAPLQLLPAGPPVVAVPPGPEPGDVLRVNVQGSGIIHVRVPDAATEGTNLQIQGVVEVRVPLDAKQGDLLTVQLPDRTEVTVELLPEDANPGQALAVAFPVEILR